MSNGRRQIKRTVYIRQADGTTIKRTTKTVGFDDNTTEVEQIIEEVYLAGCGHQGPAVWCSCCQKSLCSKCGENICQLCGRVCCFECLTDVAGEKVCKKCRWKAFWRKLWKEGF